MKKLLLMGNPNVGKSALFSRLTGVNVIASNYPGTTVKFTKGYMKIKDEKVEVIDVPGSYTLDPTSKAEEVAVEMLKEGDMILNVIDSTNLERNLNLTFQLLKKNKPIAIVLNFWDETKHKGITIDEKKLENILRIPVLPTTAATGEGIKKLVDSLPHMKVSTYTYDEDNIWNEIGKIIKEVQILTHRHHTFAELIADLSIKPVSGIFMAIIILFLSFTIIRFLGEFTISMVMDPLFEGILAPLIMRLSNLLGGSGFIHDILIGHFVEGELDFMQAFGLLTTGLYVPIAAVFPYIIAFYLILGLLEDIGYLPRLGVLLDRIMHVVGLHGMGFIPMLLGLGCNVPGALACRTMETKKERFISATLMAIAIPCWAQIVMVIGLVGKYGAGGLSLVFGVLFFIWIIIGIILKKFVKGESHEIFVEIPPYRIPYLLAVLKKLWMRLFNFIKEALPFVFLGVLLINILFSLKIINILGDITSPVITNLFGLPKETVGALIVGFVRKDVAVGMLIPLQLSFKQLIVASVVLTVYFPCVATFIVLLRELGILDMIKSAGIMIVTVLITGSLLNLSLSIFI